MAIGAAPFGEMPSDREILQRVGALAPEAGQNEPDQHVVSKVILKQFTEPWGKKGWGCPALTDRADGLSGYLPEVLLSGGGFVFGGA